MQIRLIDRMQYRKKEMQVSAHVARLQHPSVSLLAKMLKFMTDVCVD